MRDDEANRTIRTEAELQALYGTPMELARLKQLNRIDKFCRQFIEVSPFLTIGTQGVDGRADVSPRGDQPGFVKVIDEATLIIPDRPGNNRIDTLRNILANPNVGLLFFIPGFEETLRVNGRAFLTRDPALTMLGEERGKTPKLVIKVEVQEAFIHCAKAFKRSRLWDPAAQVNRKIMPSIGRIILEQTHEHVPEEVAREADDFVADDYQKNLY